MRKACLALLLACGPLMVTTPAEEAVNPVNPELLAAARTASDVYQRHIAELVDDMANAEDIEDRIVAINTLAHTVDPTVAPLIVPYLDAEVHPVPVVQAAANGIALLGFAESETSLRKMLDNEDEDVDRAVRNALSVLDRLQRLDYENEALSPDEDIRASGVTNISTARIEEATQTLVKALQDRSKHVRRMAAIGLGKIGNTSHGHELIRALHDADTLVRRYAAEAIVRLDFKPAIPYLLLSLESNIGAGDMNRAIIALTGQDFGWHTAQNRVVQQEAVERGFEWWTENADQFAE